jgi:hypothetical protein
MWSLQDQTINRAKVEANRLFFRLIGDPRLPSERNLDFARSNN